MCSPAIEAAWRRRLRNRVAGQPERSDEDPTAIVAGIIAVIDPDVPGTRRDRGGRQKPMLVFFYAQRPAAISRLTLDQIHASQQDVRLQLGLEPIALPEPLDALALQLAASRRRHAALGNQGSSRWLSPAGNPASGVSAYRLAERLR